MTEASAAAANPTKVAVELVPESATVWVTLPVQPMPCITPSLIKDFNETAARLRKEHGRETPHEDQPFKFLVLKSASDRVFSLGGDLTSMAQTIADGRIDVLEETAVGGATASYNLANGFGCCFVTISLVRGRAFGGGFETARCCHVMTAEKGAAFQLPEASVGLFPANGIATVLAPKIGYRLARRLTLEGTKMDTSAAYEAGILDEVYEAGQGEHAVRESIARLTPTHAAQVAFEHTIRRQNNITLDALIAETTYWSETVRHLSPSSLEKMLRVGTIQRKMFGKSR